MRIADHRLMNIISGHTVNTRRVIGPNK
jgi:hypothetical protein